MKREELLRKVAKFHEQTRKLAVLGMAILISVLVGLMLAAKYFKTWETELPQTILIVFAFVVAGSALFLSVFLLGRKRKQFGLFCNSCKTWWADEHLEETLKDGRCTKCGTQLFEFTD